MRVEWAEPAKKEWGHAVLHALLSASPEAAVDQDDAFDRASDRLARFPHLGRPGSIPGTRDYVVPHTRYLVRYRIHQGRIEVLRLVDTVRRQQARSPEPMN